MFFSRQKKYLSRYYKAKLRIRMLREQIEELETLAAGRAIVPNNMPKPKNKNYDPVQENSVRIADLQTELQQEIDQAEELAAEVIRSINKVQDKDEHAVLTLRYVDCKRWDEIAGELGFSEQRMYQIHDRALQRIRLEKTREE